MAKIRLVITFQLVIKLSKKLMKYYENFAICGFLVELVCFENFFRSVRMCKMAFEVKLYKEHNKMQIHIQ